MIDANFIQKIIELSPTNLTEIGERKFADGQFTPIKEPTVSSVTCHTLTGLVDFFDTLPLVDQERAIFMVEDFNKVHIVSEIFGPEKQREYFITAESYRQEDPFGKYHRHEDFMIKILSLFVQDEVTANILKIIGNLKSEAGTAYSDDGLSQTVTAKTGITKVENINLPNPTKLRPYRTFSDIDQPESSFVLRLKQGDGIAVALFEADGAAWKNKAIQSIKQYLESRKIGVKVIA